MANAIPGRVKHVGEHELDRFAFRKDAASVAARQRLEQAIDSGGAWGRWHRYSPRELVKPTVSPRNWGGILIVLTLRARSHLLRLRREYGNAVAPSAC